MNANLVIIRHGQSQFNLENRFAGWIDTNLTAEGENQAKKAAEVLQAANFVPDIIFVSPLTRTLRTAKFIYPNAEHIIDARLVERFYGDMSGKNKEQTLKEIGDDMFQKIRRGYETQPAPIQPNNSELANITECFERTIKGTFTNEIPATESLKDVEQRVIPFVEEKLKPALAAGKKVFICAHGNSLRALIKIIKNIPAEAIAKVELETAQPAGFVIETTSGNLNVTSDSVGKHFTDWATS